MSGGSTTITAAQAQAEHEALAMTRVRGDQHRARSWRNCEACRRRHQATNTQVKTQ